VALLRSNAGLIYGNQGPMTRLKWEGEQFVQRVILAFVLTPLLMSFLFGPLFLLVAAIAWIVCLVVGAPLFILFAYKGWLQCWQVVVAGLVCGLLAGSALTLDNGLYSEIQGPANLAMYGGIGTAVAYVFWWFGLYRNPRFGESAGLSAVPALFPLPVLAGLGLLYVLYTPSASDAVVTDIPTTAIDRGAADVRLADGSIVQAAPRNEKRSVAGEKVVVRWRRCVTLVGKRYWIM
jgi:hypothetical protein